MQLRNLVLSGVFLAFSSACSGGSGETSATHGGTGGTGSLPPSLTPGSYNLLVQAVEGTARDYQGDVDRSRLDIRRDGEAYQSVLTPRWGDPAVYQVAVGESGVTLEGESEIRWYTGDPTVTLVLRQIRLASDGVGGIAFEATGQAIYKGTDFTKPTDAITARGKLEPDSVGPEARIRTPYRFGGGSSVFPWRPIHVELAEGVDGLDTGISISDVTNGAPLSMSWRFEPSSAAPGAWPGATKAIGVRTDWIETTSLMEVTLSNQSDPSGNVLQPMVERFNVRALGDIATAHTFDTDLTTVTAWSGTWVESNLHCPEGGCALLGPVTSASCGSPSAGMGGQLQAGGASKLTIRYRALFDEEMPVNDELVVEMAAPGVEEPVTESIRLPSGTPLTEALEGMTYGSEWTELELAIPPAWANGTIGFAIAAQSPSQFPCAPFTNGRFAVLIDSVEVR